MKALKVLVILVAMASMNVQAQDAQTNNKEAGIQKSVDLQRYIFIPQSAAPSRGQTVHLTSDYELKVSKDTIQSYLPYFGRAYSAPIDRSGGGLQFTSTNFDYQTKARKKNGWDITIKPKNGHDVREMLLTVFTNGTATLRVTSNNREPITFHGYITERN